MYALPTDLLCCVGLSLFLLCCDTCCPVGLLLRGVCVTGSMQPAGSDLDKPGGLSCSVRGSSAGGTRTLWEVTYTHTLWDRIVWCSGPLLMLLSLVLQ
jgi:hypothetical protein